MKKRILSVLSFEPFKTPMCFLYSMNKQKTMKYNIDATIVPLNSLDTKLTIGTVIMLWNKDKQINIQLLVNSIEQNCITATKVASDGIPIPKINRSKFIIDNETFKDNKLFYTLDKTNDQHLWPSTVKEAVLKLSGLYNDVELQQMCKLEWKEFDSNFNGFGGLSMWIRNYFGLNRGNFDLALDCNIDNPTPDDVSAIIVYYFWEFLNRIN